MKEERFWSNELGGRGAFTLMELLAVLAIVGILASLAIGTLGYVNRKGAEGRARAEVAALSAAIDRFHSDHGSYPVSATMLFRELTGQGEINDDVLYFEPSNESRKAGLFISPWGSPYEYNGTNAASMRNVGFYDLWVAPPDATNEADWIHN